MPKSPNSKEKDCEHNCNLTFNQRKISKVTITDHYQKKPGREWITHELIINLVKTFDGREIEPEPKEKPDDRDVFIRDRIPYDGKNTD